MTRSDHGVPQKCTCLVARNDRDAVHRKLGRADRARLGQHGRNPAGREGHTVHEALDLGLVVLELRRRVGDEQPRIVTVLRGVVGAVRACSWGISPGVWAGAGAGAVSLSIVTSAV